MTAVVPDSKELRSALEALPEERKQEIRAKRHPWIGPRRMLIVIGRSFAGDGIVRDLVDQFGQCRWSGGRWHIDKAQLSLFPSTGRPPASTGQAA